MSCVSGRQSDPKSARANNRRLAARGRGPPTAIVCGLRGAAPPPQRGLPMTDTADLLTSGARCVRKNPTLVWRQRGGEADV